MQNDEKGILRCNVLHINILNSHFTPKDWCYFKRGENHHNMFKFSEKRKLLTHLSKTSQYFQNIFSRFPTKVDLFSWIWWAISYVRHSESHSLLTAWNSFASRQNVETFLFSILDDILAGLNYKFSTNLDQHYAQFPGGVSKTWNFNITVKLH